MVGVVREPIFSDGGGLQLKPSCLHVHPSVRFERARRETQAVIFITLNRTPLASIFHHRLASERASSREEVMCDYLHTHPPHREEEVPTPNSNKRSSWPHLPRILLQGLAVVVVVADHNFLVFMPRSKLFTFLRAAFVIFFLLFNLPDGGSLRL